MYDHLLTLFSRTVHDADPYVSTYTVVCLSSLIPFLERHYAHHLQALVPASLQAIRKCLEVDEELAAKAMDLLDECVNSEARFLKVFITDFCMFCLQVCIRGQSFHARSAAVPQFMSQSCPSDLPMM